MKFSNSTEELEVLTSKVLDEHASKEEQKRLCTLINSSATLRKRYASIITHESLLHWEIGQVNEISYEKSVSEKFLSFPVISTLAASLIALACVWGFSKTAQINHASKDLIASSGYRESQSTKNSPLISSLKQETTDLASVDILYPSSSDFRVELDTISHAQAIATASHAIEVLENNLNYDRYGQIESLECVSSWHRKDHAGVPAQNGILPYEGDQMISFSELIVNVDAQIAEVSETLQVLDLRAFAQENSTQITKLDAEVFFNKGVSVLSESTEFSLSVHALKNNENFDKESLGISKNTLQIDSNLETWEKVESEWLVPPGTDFLVVALSARQDGPEALLPNDSGYYADHLKINLRVDDGSVIGPL